MLSKRATRKSWVKKPLEKTSAGKRSKRWKKKVMVVEKKSKNKIIIIIITENLVGMTWVNFILQGGTLEWKAGI